MIFAASAGKSVTTVIPLNTSKPAESCPLRSANSSNYGSTQSSKEEEQDQKMCFELCVRASMESTESEDRALTSGSPRSDEALALVAGGSSSSSSSSSSNHGNGDSNEGSPSDEKRNYYSLKGLLSAHAQILHTAFYGRVDEATRRARVESDNRTRLLQKASKSLREQQSQQSKANTPQKASSIAGGGGGGGVINDGSKPLSIPMLNTNINGRAVRIDTSSQSSDAVELKYKTKPPYPPPP